MIITCYQARFSFEGRFKIALELYVKCGVKRHGEVSIFFAKREHGESKLTGKVR